MKKYPYVFLGIFISIFVFFIIHVVFVSIRLNDDITVKKIDAYYEKIDNCDKKISKIKDDTCRQNLEIMSKRIKDTYYENDIKIKDYYNNYFIDNTPFDKFYLEVASNCNIENVDIYNKVLESMVFPYQIKDRYLGSYQIKVDDIFVLKNEIKMSDELGTYSNKMLELEVLENLINGVQK